LVCNELFLSFFFWFLSFSKLLCSY
jgi:hypothetical protein